MGERRSRVAVTTLSLVALAALTTSGCAFGNRDNPYRGLAPAPGAEHILEDVNLAAVGLRSYPCDLFEAPVSRCYAPDHWLSVRDGREVLAHAHRELVNAGARFWGSTDSPVTAESRPVVSGLDLGCYFDYEAGDVALRLVIVGPAGEAEPCVNGLPGDGVSQVWIIGAPFSPEAVYGGPAYSTAFETLLQSIPPRPARPDAIYGGDHATAEGYYGPQLAAVGDGYGLRILTETVAVNGGVIRGLVQYQGAAPTVIPAPAAPQGQPSPSVTTSTIIANETQGATGVVISVGNERYEIPMVVRPGESAPFELPLPAGFDSGDLMIVPSWSHAHIEWDGGLRLSGPTTNAGCGTVPGLQPGSGQSCFEFVAQATTTVGTWIVVDAVTATFAADGTVTDVMPVYVIREEGEPSLTRLHQQSPDIRLDWVAASGSAGVTGVWVRYIKQDSLASEG